MNMAVWHKTERGDNQFVCVCLHFGGVRRHRCSQSTWLVFLPQKQASKHGRREVTRAGGEGFVSVASHRAPSQKPRLPLSDLCPRSRHISCQRDTFRAARKNKNEGIFEITVLAPLQGSAVSGARAPIEKEHAEAFFRLPFTPTL